MGEFADVRSAVALVDRLLDLVAEGTIGRGGVLTIPRGAELLALVRQLTFPSESGPLDELVFDAGRWVGSREAAGSLGCSPQWIRVLARKGLLRAEQHEGRWLIAKTSIGQYAAAKAQQPPAKGDQSHTPGGLHGSE